MAIWIVLLVVFPCSGVGATGLGDYPLSSGFIRTNSPFLGPIARVDSNVFFRQVAGPEPRPPAAFPANCKPDQTFGLVELLLQFGLGKIRRNPRAAHRNALDRRHEAVAQALRIFRDNEWVEDLGRGQTPISVKVKSRKIEHTVRVQDFERWLEASPRSPAEMILKNRLRELLAKGS